MAKLRHLVQLEKQVALTAFTLSGSLTAAAIAPMMDMALLAVSRLKGRPAA